MGDPADHGENVDGSLSNHLESEIDIAGAGESDLGH
jgi:hypothetical protein